MDQDAFRNLLSSGSGSGSGKPKSRGLLGGAAPKRGGGSGGGWGIKAKPGHEYKPPPEVSSTTFAPRNQKKRDITSDVTGKYVDRAALRRQGKEDEYTHVEQLLADLEKRQKDEGMEDKEIEKQRAYLGGDATHTILVKGLDHALLARTRAELAAKGEEVADEELEALVLAKGKKQGDKTDKPEEKKEEESMAKGFKSIASKGGTDTGEKKKKKKKKVKQEVPSADTTPLVGKKDEAEDAQVENTAGPSRVVKEEKPVKAPSPTPVDDDDDIFGDAGDYDLKAGREDEDTSDEEEDGSIADEEGELKHSRRSRSVTPPRRRQPSEGLYDSRDGRDRRDYDRRDRSDSRERYRDRSVERDDHRRRYSSPSPDRSRDRNHRSRPYDDRHASPRRSRYDDRDRYDRDRYDRDRYDDLYRRGYSRERYDERRDPYPTKHARSPPRRSQLHESRSPSPPPKRPRQKTRSPSPLTFDFVGRAPSPTPSEESDNDLMVGGKLQPLHSSALQDVKGYLSLDAEAAKDEERRARKAKWRARQGLALQEGSEKFLEREVGDKEKLNRDYVNVMNKVKKAEGGN